MKKIIETMLRIEAELPFDFCIECEKVDMKESGTIDNVNESGIHVREVRCANEEICRNAIKKQAETFAKEVKKTLPEVLK